jgi:hypothetical protein
MARFTGGSGGGSGIPGPRGPEGDSAYDVAVANGFVGTEQEWLDSLGGDSQGIVPLPDFLTYAEGRDQLPTLNQNFGWDSNGVWFGPTSDNGNDDSYPIFTNFTIPQNTDSSVSFDVEVDEFCSDAGVAIYVDGEIPQWNFGTNPTRIAAQFNCPTPELQGINFFSGSEVEGLQGPGIYRMVLIYSPTAETNKVVYQVYTTGEESSLLFELNLDEALPEGDYRIGFAADMDPGDGGRTYIQNLVITVGGDTYEDSLTNGNSGAPLVNLANFIFEPGIIKTSDNDSVTIEGGDDLTLHALEDDVRIWADDDIRFVSDYNNDEHNWRFNSEGGFELPGEGLITNPYNSSGDNNGASTLRLIPDENLTSNDQYLIIDPTQPNHIHIRAGGEQDNSNAELILGGEQTGVRVADYGYITINTKRQTISNSYQNFNDASTTAFITNDINADIGYGYIVNVNGIDYQVSDIQENSPFDGYKTIQASNATFTAGETYTFYSSPQENYWEFRSDGVLSGPEMGNLVVYGITNHSSDYSFNVFGKDTVTISGQNGEFLRNPEFAENQIATIGDIGVETEYAVQGGTDGTQPTFSGDPLFAASYVRMSSNLVHFQIQVDMDNITSFGSGQYYMTLPFDAKTNYIFRDGCVHDVSTGKEYHISGHVSAGSNELILFSSAKDGNSVEDVSFTSTVPFALATDDNFHIAGTYIAEVAL